MKTLCRLAPAVLCLILAPLGVGLPIALAHGDHAGPPGRTAEGKSPAKLDEKTPEPKGESGTGKEEKPKWDVSRSTGPTSEVTLDTSEGTWMSLDVSPDGKEVVFDLLGDLYLLPIGGGEARALTTGLAWDMQPRFSPDGQLIAFSSDRAGGDNVWLMKRDGSDPRQVTQEDFRLLNSPVWTPDGQYIVARKHFTSRRSLGAGEMWLYHRSGGEGLQLTKRPNDQKDVGEPAMSPDGRYLYYSQDATPGDVFEYNKDPNGEIYIIQRLDRETGETERFVTGSGGSVRPTPSPDGKWLAFVRRVRTRSVLYLHDLTTGAEWPIYDGLDRDMQETWAVHGVYPAMAWTPDSRAVVFWAGGKIHRIDASSRKTSDIPFHVRATRTVTEALRYPVEVAPDRFPVRMLRDVEVSPSGDQVVYQALGHLYIKALPDGDPRRLTRQIDHLELNPSFSRDGRWIVYVTWDDDTLASIRIAPAKGGAGKVLVARAGHYAEPAFSPDGKTVVFRKTGGGWLISPRGSHDQGIYAVPVKGGAPWWVTKQGYRPHFGASSDRVYLIQPDPEERLSLMGIDLDGSDARTYLTVENATELRLSPDERWVAFREGFNAYIGPFARTGKAAEISARSKAIPLRRVSRDAGEYLHWSADSQRLHWSLGPELFTRALKDAFLFVPGAPEKLPEPLEKGVLIGFSEKADVPTGRLALVGGRIIPMKGDQVIEDGTVLIDGNRIAAVGPRDQVPVPPGVKVIDVKGHTLLPGLVDVHWHGGQGENDIVPQQNWQNLASLAFGVTTVHDPSNDTGTIFTASELARAGRITAPRIYSTGTILYGAKSAFKAQIDSLDDARTHLRRMKAVGAFSVKSYNQPRREQRQQVLAAARELNMMVVPEGGALFQHNMTMLVDGHTGIEHAMPIGRIYQDVIQLWAGTRVGYTPTLVVAYGGLSGENYWYQHTKVWENERLLTFVPRHIVDARARRPAMAPEEEYNHIQASRICKQLSDKGVSIQLGAHGQREGLGAHWEIWMLVQGGMTPLEALRTATLSGARYLGLDKDIGSLEPGKLADLIVLEKNPLEDIRQSEQIRYTMVNGRLFDARTLNEIGNHPRSRAPLFWETPLPAP